MFFKKKPDFIIKPLLNKVIIKEAIDDIDYHLDFVEDTNKGFHIEELRNGFEDLRKELKIIL